MMKAKENRTLIAHKRTARAVVVDEHIRVAVVATVRHESHTRMRHDVIHGGGNL